MCLFSRKVVTWSIGITNTEAYKYASKYKNLMQRSEVLYIQATVEKP